MLFEFIHDFLLNALEIIICLYAVIHHHVKKCSFLNRLLQFKGVHVILIIVCILLSIISVLFLLVLLLPLTIYRKFVDILLQHIHKDEYGGLLEGIDEMWALEVKESRHIINCLLFVNFTIPEEQIMKTVKEIYAEKIVYHFTSIRKRRLGYYYRLKNQVSPDDLIKEMILPEGTRSDQENFERELGKVCNSEMPMNDTASFELLVGTKPVDFSNGNGKSYPVLMRIHHSVGDGVALLNFLLKNLVDEEISIEKQLIEGMMTSTKKFQSNKIFNHLQEYAKQIYLKLKQIKVYHFAPTSPADSNILHGPKLSGEKILAYYVEDSPGNISRIKNLKKRIPDSTFTDILMTAVSASFWEYYEQNSNNNVPEQIHLTFVVRPREKNLQYTVSKITGKKEIKLGNRFSMGVLGLPIRLNSGSNSSELMARLAQVKAESEKLKNSVDILVYYWQLRFLTNLLPASIMSYIVSLNQASSVMLSNLPGIKAVHIHGYKVQDVIFWLPNIRNMGVGFSILTYDDRFQLGLVADKVLISSPDKARMILENTVKYIDLLDRQTQNEKNAI